MEGLRPRADKRIRTEPPTREEEEEEKTLQFPPFKRCQSVLSSTKKKVSPSLTFVIENASLEMGYVKKTAKLLNSDEHANFLLKQKKNLNDFRPDILYRALLTIFDSPLTKAGLVRAIYVKTEKGVLFEVKPHVRIPRTPKRFYGLMFELLQKSCIRAKDTDEKLLHVIEQPVTRHLPGNSRIICLSYSSEKLVNLKDYAAAAVNDDVNLVFVVGAMMHGTIAGLYTDECISVSNFPLSCSKSVGKICDALERKWGYN